MKNRLLAILGLTVLLAGDLSARAETVVSDGSEIVMTGEIVSIEGDGFALKHENGMTLVSLEDINGDKKAALQDANLIKAGNRVTVTGTLEKGDFNNPVIVANNLVVAAIPEIGPPLFKNTE